MNVEDILLGREKLISFLKEKGFEEEKEYYDEEFKEGFYFKIDKRKLLVLYEVFEEEKIKEIKDHFLIDRGLSYCVIILDGKLIFFRNFGETKYFIYSERTKDNVFKQDKVQRIRESFDCLFQTEDNSAKFYEKFRLKRNVLVQHIKNNIEPVHKYLIAQKLFDRFFFIYFLCHKGIIKFEDGRKISGENLFSKILLNKGNFLQNLKELFRLFNSQDKNFLEIEDFKIFIPYLNGGLFRPDILEEDLDIRLKNEQWTEIFDFLNSYHWIIEDVRATEENEERILTPEILGHVYERSVVEWENEGFEKEAKNAVNKISERKRKGVYYTPEPITDYISNNTIIPYLMDRLGGKLNSFDELIESKNNTYFKKALEILSEIKVLDPACGSGAFLIKASEVLFYLKRRLYYELKIKENFYDLKLDIITENMYGVDILAGAIEIAKLRLWLWLIASFDESKNEIKSLPNIEYNLKVGNSLVGWLNEKLVQVPLSIPLTEKTNKIFSELISSSVGSECEDLGKALKMLSEYKLNDYIQAYSILCKIYRKTHGLKADNLRNIIETIRESIYRVVTPTFSEYVNAKMLGIDYGKPHKQQSAKHKNLRLKPPISKEEFHEIQIFHWRIDFGNIILNGGFDVVIANPPYVDSETMVKKGDKQRKICPALFESASGNWDLFIPFVQRGLMLTIRKGTMSYIVPNKLIGAKYSEQIKLILASKSIIELRDYSSVKVFKDANVYPITFVIQNYEPEKEVLITVMESDEIIDYSNLIPKNLFFQDTDWSRYFIENKEALKILVEMSKHKILGNFHKDISGAATVNEAYEIKELIYENSHPNKNEKKFINTGTIDPYLSFWGHEKTRYIKSSYSYPVLKNSDLSKHFPNRFKQACSEKIIIGGMTKRLECYYDSGNYLAGKSTTIIMPGSKHLKFILSILNSKLISFWFKVYFKSLTLAGGFLSINNNEIKKIPIFDSDSKQQIVLIELVTKIIELTSDKNYFEDKEKQNKVENIQKRLDSIVYDIYKLTPEEINIVEDFINKNI